MSDTQDFKRQRRNLVLISLLLLFSQSVGLNFQKLNVFGNEFGIETPGAIIGWLWLFWLYWLWRFFCFSQEIHPDAKFLSSVTYHTREFAREIALKRCSHLGNAADFAGMDGSCIKFDDMAANNGNRQRCGQIEIKGWDLRFCKIKAWTKITLTTSRFSEYVLPYLIASLPVIYFLLSRIFLAFVHS